MHKKLGAHSIMDPSLKELSYLAIFDKWSPMSGRISSAIMYTVIRAGEIIDWWFPVPTKF